MRLYKSCLGASAVAVAMFGTSAPAQAQAGTQFIGQVSAFAGVYCPREWADASGQLLPISSNTALFSLLGTSFGGDGRTTFGLPDLRGRTPVGLGNAPGIGNFAWGQKGGTTSFVVLPQNLPSHTHSGTVRASRDPADTNGPARNSHARTVSTFNIFSDTGNTTNNMAPNTLAINPTGGGLAVNKVSPYQTVRWCVALTGIYPSRS